MEDNANTTAVDSNMFEAPEKEFQDVLIEHVGEKSLEKLSVEYEKLIAALKKSQENEKKWMTQCRDLKAQIRSDANKLEAGLQRSHKDQLSIRGLRKELSQTREMLDVAHEKEKTDKDTIKTLQQEIDDLTIRVEQGAALTAAEARCVNDLIKMKDQVTAERDELLSELMTLRDNFETATTKQLEAEEANLKNEEAILQLQQNIQECQNECLKEIQQKEKLEEELKELHADVEAQLLEIKTLGIQCHDSNEERQRLEQQLQEQKILNERVSNDLEKMQVRNTKLQHENEQKTLSVEMLNVENTQQASELRMVKEKVSQMNQEFSKLTKIREATDKKLHLTEDQKLEVEQQRDTLKNEITGLNKKIEMAQKQADSDKKKIDALVREKDMLSNNVKKAANATEKQLNLVKQHEQTKKTLDQKILNLQNEAQKQDKIISQLEKERLCYISKCSSLTQKVLSNKEELKVQQVESEEHKKKRVETEKKLIQQQKLSESIMAESKNCSENLHDAQNSIAELKHKVKCMSQENGQLTEEIKSKEAALVKEHLEFQRVENEKEILKAELQKMKQQGQETKQYMDNQEEQHNKLQKIIADTDAERVQQKKELENLLSQRDILGSQITRRNDELALLYEKIKIQQNIMDKGMVEYNQRMEDIRLLKMEISKLQKEKTDLQQTMSEMEDLRIELDHVQKELLKEQAKCRSLQEELENPMNVHRWRILEASDPNTFELIQKIHSLQRSLLTKNKELAEKESLLQENKKLYVQLKHTFDLQPGPEAAEQLQLYKQKLREKNKQVKALSAEINMYKSRSEEKS
ncbi:cilia- and flagella-associated protein 58-like [Clarias gariepinus]|uniref:cilia- and flagella-associated protein 58-like n=1 Tax=Clarias gariepinus TaxID=13013 RepID=UPI00234CD504|nr:cilia- and flagella-associated protein 58-like [Clarias gariepinus]